MILLVIPAFFAVLLFGVVCEEMLWFLSRFIYDLPEKRTGKKKNLRPRCGRYDVRRVFSSGENRADFFNPFFTEIKKEIKKEKN